MSVIVYTSIQKALQRLFAAMKISSLVEELQSIAPELKPRSE